VRCAQPARRPHRPLSRTKPRAPISLNPWAAHTDSWYDQPMFDNVLNRQFEQPWTIRLGWRTSLTSASVTADCIWSRYWIYFHARLWGGRWSRIGWPGWCAPPCRWRLLSASQYASQNYRNLLSQYGLQAAWAVKATTEIARRQSRFFLSLKHEQLNYEKFRIKEAAKLNIIDYLAFYNGKSAHSKLSCQSPLEFERKLHKKSA